MKQQTNVKVVKLISNDDQVFLKVTVGNGHPSLTTVYRNGNKIAELSDPYTNYLLGCKKDLIGGDILIVTSIHDLPENPNVVIVSHNLIDQNSIIMSSNFNIDIDEGEVAICNTQIYFLLINNN